MMNLRSIDLNLLVVLDALLDEAHVSRAAHRLNLSQPAVSNALQRCRDLFDDPLLERGRGTMSRTPKGELLRGPLKLILAEVIELVDPPEIPLSDLEQVIRITTADDPMAILIGPLMAKMRETAPGVTIVFQAWQGSDAAARALTKSDTDLAISVFDKDLPGVEVAHLLDEVYVVAMREGHPVAENFNFETWLAWPHVIVSGRGDLRSPLDSKLEREGFSRKVGVVVPSFRKVPLILANTDMLAMLPRQSYALEQERNLISFPPPIEVEGFDLQVAWHVRNSKDAGIRHVIELMKSIFGQLEI